MPDAACLFNTWKTIQILLICLLGSGPDLFFAVCVCLSSLSVLHQLLDPLCRKKDQEREHTGGFYFHSMVHLHQALHRRLLLRVDKLAIPDSRALRLEIILGAGAAVFTMRPAARLSGSRRWWIQIW